MRRPEPRATGVGPGGSCIVSLLSICASDARAAASLRVAGPGGKCIVSLFTVWAFDARHAAPTPRVADTGSGGRCIVSLLSICASVARDCDMGAFELGADTAGADAVEVAWVGDVRVPFGEGVTTRSFATNSSGMSPRSDPPALRPRPRTPRPQSRRHHLATRARPPAFSAWVRMRVWAPVPRDSPRVSQRWAPQLEKRRRTH